MNHKTSIYSKQAASVANSASILTRCFSALMLLSLALPLFAQSIQIAPPQTSKRLHHFDCDSYIVPCGRIITTHHRHPHNIHAGVQLAKIDAFIDINDQIATTTLKVNVHNRSRFVQESKLLLPIPPGATVSRLAIDGGDSLTSVILKKGEASALYQQIVSTLRDPALLEFKNESLVQSSVFPVAPGKNRILEITYETILKRNGARVDYYLPRTQALSYRVPWAIDININTSENLSTVFSPSHRITVGKQGVNSAEVQLAAAARLDPGPLQLSYLLAQSSISSTLYTYPDEDGSGGYYFFLAGLPTENELRNSQKLQGREVTIVLDRSGSMVGEKLEQVKSAVRQILVSLEEGERFNIVSYAEDLDLFSSQPVDWTPDNLKLALSYVDKQAAKGGTNIHRALEFALAQKPSEGRLPLVLFMTDGLPTIGVTSEAKIREMANKNNLHKRRIFTFGVGSDVNTPLLDKISSNSRASATYVLNNAELSSKVSAVFQKLKGPVLSSPKLQLLANSDTSVRKISHSFPKQLHDLFIGDQLTLTGRYEAGESICFEISGQYLGSERAFIFHHPIEENRRFSFVPRLWASRRIGSLVEQVRFLGADPNLQNVNSQQNNPQTKELIDEIVRLSTKYGVLTEYTNFLAAESNDLANYSDNRALTEKNVKLRAFSTRKGLGAVNQSLNNDTLNLQSCLNPRNGQWDASMNFYEVGNIQQLSNRTFYRRANRWVESRVIQTEKPARTIIVGSPEFEALIELLSKNHCLGVLSLSGEIFVELSGEAILILPKAEAKAQPEAKQEVKQGLDGC